MYELMDKKEREERRLKNWADMLHENTKTLSDKIKVMILDKLIEVAEAHGGAIQQKDLELIRVGVEEARKKDKEKQMKAIGDVLEHMMKAFDSSKPQGSVNGASK